MSLLLLGGVVVACGSSIGTGASSTGSTTGPSSVVTSETIAPITTFPATSPPTIPPTAASSAAPSTTPTSAVPAAPVSLFDGKDFSGWDRYLASPSAGAPPLGIDNDPQGVYSVVTIDGAPAIRISGQTWGSLISQQTYCDFDLKLEYKWGTMVWPPLNSFDSGVMVMSVGPLGAVNAGGRALSDPVGSGGFMVSMEYQVAKGDVGDMGNLGPIDFTLGPPTSVAGEVEDAWNSVEIVHRGGTLQFLLNGALVKSGSAFSIAWPGVQEGPLTCGKVQLQSEGAEIYFRNVTIKTSA